MKATTILVLSISLGLFVLICGCEESGQAGDRQARLIANENMQLQEQIKSLNKEIQKQKELLATCQEAKKAIAASEGSRKFDEGVIELLEKSNKKVAELTKENMELKERIKELEAGLARPAETTNEPLSE